MESFSISKTLCLCITAITFVAPFTSAAEFVGGTGEPNDPFQIATAEQLVSIGSDPNLLNKHFVLVADIDLDPNLPGGCVFSRAVIAPDIDTIDWHHRSPMFAGVFDGHGHMLSNLVIEDANGEHIGLFGYVGAAGSVLNLRVGNAIIKGSFCVGGIAAVNTGFIENCHVNGVLGGANMTGGIGGENTGIVRRSHAEVRINGRYRTGGLLGANNGEIVQCYVTGQISGSSDVGGLLGSNHGSVVSCYSWASVSGSDYIGGLIGYDYGTITTSYATGKVTRGTRNGGLTGIATTTAFSSYWDWQTSGFGRSASGRPMTTQQMQDPETFRGWGHDGAWVLDAGLDYPRLAWEGTAGEPIVDEAHRYGGGTGSLSDPYQIWTAEQFCNIAWYRADFDKHFVLMSNIDINDADPRWVKPIGAHGDPFMGVFDGNHHIIRNFRYGTAPSTVQRNMAAADGLDRGPIYPSPPVVPELPPEHHVGVFGVIGEIRFDDPCPARYDELRGVVRNLRVVDVKVSGIKYVGGLAGVNRGVVSACSTSGYVAGSSCIGGLIGGNGHYGSKGLAQACFSVSDVVGEFQVGGLVGANGEWCTGIVESCYAAGNVNGYSEAGGLIGHNEGTVATSYSVGEVMGALDQVGGWTGGLMGFNVGACYLSYWDVDSSGIVTSAAGQGRTTTQMWSRETYRGWGSSGVWTIDDGNDYPRLAWQGQAGEAIVVAPYGYGGGTGIAEDPYQISTADEFVAIAYHQEDFDKHFILMQDIDLAGIDPNRIVPIGNPAFPFCGVFDGGNHTVYNFCCVPDGESYLGVFGSVAGGHIERLHLVDAEVAGLHCVGMLVGDNQGTIASCSVHGRCSGSQYVGGLTGGNQNTIIDSRCAGVVAGGWAVGGLVGQNMGDVISCGFDGQVTAGDSVGGLVGRHDYGATIRASRAEGAVSGSRTVGGLVGYNYGSTTSSYAICVVAGTSDYIGGLVGSNPGNQVAYCYSAGTVLGSKYVGGLIGATGDRAYNCYWDVEASGMPSSWTGMGRSTREMMSAETFSGWGYPGVWVIDEGRDYPRLVWEGTSGQPITDSESRYSYGTGDPNTPYEIRTALDFIGLAYYQQDFDKHFVLTNDIDLSSVDPNLLMPIGTRTIPFTGVFDGNGHTISYFSYTAKYEYSVGVFGAIKEMNTGQEGTSGLVRNLGIVDATISGQNIAGALVGYNAGTVISCYSADNSIESTYNAGGLVGYNDGLVTASWSSNIVNGRSNVGGLVGYNGCTIESCYSTTDVDGEQRVGGLVGTSSGTIAGCYSVGMVDGEADFGGLLGANVSSGHESWGEIMASFWDTQSSGVFTGVGNLEPDPVGALGKSTAQMQTAATFIDTGWDFENIWMICEGKDYPRLQWENVQCEE